MKQKFFFQELPSDIQQIVFEGVRFRLSREPLAEGLGLLDIESLLHEEVDYSINCHNWKRTVAEWLGFTQTGE